MDLFLGFSTDFTNRTNHSRREILRAHLSLILNGCTFAPLGCHRRVPGNHGEITEFRFYNPASVPNNSWWDVVSDALSSPAPWGVPGRPVDPYPPTKYIRRAVRRVLLGRHRRLTGGASLLNGLFAGHQDFPQNDLPLNQQRRLSNSAHNQHRDVIPTGIAPRCCSDILAPQ